MKRERRGAGRVKGYYANHEKRFVLQSAPVGRSLLSHGVRRPVVTYLSFRRSGDWAGAKASNSTPAKKQAQARVGRIAG
jgi:hypothetical protein